jgi:hypothetical protein
MLSHTRALTLRLAFATMLAAISLNSYAQILSPQGRLTLTSNTSVMTTDVTAATVVYYTPYDGNSIPIYGGSSFANTAFSQLTMTLNSSNQASGDIYDLFVFLNSGTVTIGAGPAWSSSTSRGTGSGTTQLTQLNGVWVNANTITLTNGSTSYSSIPANEATYVGSVYMTAAGETAMQFNPSPAGGGTANVLGVYNAYNQVKVVSNETDDTGSWTYTSSTVHPADSSTSNRITWLDGLGQSSASASYQIVAEISNAQNIAIGIGVDSTTTYTGAISDTFGYSSTMGNQGGLHAAVTKSPLLGLHYVQALENAPNGIAGTGTYFTLIGSWQSYNLSLAINM